MLVFDKLLRDGSGGGGLTFELECVFDEPTLLAPLDELGVHGASSRSPGPALGILPTLFGGGANVLTSLVSIVAKYLASVLPEKEAKVSIQRDFSCILTRFRICFPASICGEVACFRFETLHVNESSATLSVNE